VVIVSLNIRIINAATGELLRELTLDPTRDYQPLGRPPGPPKNKNRTPDKGPVCPGSLERSHGWS